MQMITDPELESESLILNLNLNVAFHLIVNMNEIINLNVDLHIQ